MAIRPLELVLTGNARSATCAYSLYVSATGFPCGHERIYNLGGDRRAQQYRKERPEYRAESSWLAAPWLNAYLIKGAILVHLVRHPKLVIESWLRTPKAIEKGHHYWEYAARHCPRMSELDSDKDRCAHRYVQWNRLIERGAEGRQILRFGVERSPIFLLNALVDLGLPLCIREEDGLYQKRTINHHEDREVEPFSFDQIKDDRVREELEEISEEYGYAW